MLYVRNIATEFLGQRDTQLAHRQAFSPCDIFTHSFQFLTGIHDNLCCREHLGILNDPDFVDLTDVHLDRFYKEVWIKQAAINTTCYDKVCLICYTILLMKKQAAINTTCYDKVCLICYTILLMKKQAAINTTSYDKV